MGTLVDFQGHSTWSWRHWCVHRCYANIGLTPSPSYLWCARLVFIRGCVTPKVLKNMKKKHPEAEDLDGYEELEESRF
jgi:hypothetical protein